MGVSDLEAVADFFPEIRQRFAESGHALPETIRLECDCTFAVGTWNSVVALKPSDGVMKLIAAIRATKGQEVKVG